MNWITIKVPEDIYLAWRKWQTTQNETHASIPTTSVKRPRVDVSPQKSLQSYSRLQLPLRIFTTFRGEYIEGILWWLDNTDGGRKIPQSNKRAASIVQIIQVPPSLRKCEKIFTGTLTKAINFLFNNTQSGWTAWKVWQFKAERPIGEYRLSKNGPGFLNCPELNTKHRDYLISLCVDACKHHILNPSSLEQNQVQCNPTELLRWLKTLLPERKITSSGCGSG